MSKEDLIPFDQRTEAEQKKIARMGGIASGKARRRKRSMKEATDYYLSLPVADKRSWNKLARKGVDPEDIDNQMAIVIGLSEAAAYGDARAATVLAKWLGEDAPQEDTGEDALKRAEGLLGGIESVIE